MNFPMYSDHQFQLEFYFSANYLCFPKHPDHIIGMIYYENSIVKSWIGIMGFIYQPFHCDTSEYFLTLIWNLTHVIFFLIFFNSYYIKLYFLEMNPEF